MIKNKIIILVLPLTLLISCKSKQYIINENSLPDKVAESFHTQQIEYKLQPYDYLYIKISSTNDEINKLYSNISSISPTTSGNNSANFFLTGYLITDSGYVFVPTIGNIYVKGLTINEARYKIQTEVNKILKDAVVNVRLTNFNVFFLGEFNKTGKSSFYKERVNILEAIGQAGGLTNYANMKHIKVIRPNDSVYYVYDLDLTNKHIIESKDFYIYPNDIIYAPPRNKKMLFENMRDYSAILTTFTATATTTILILQLIKK